MGSFLGELGGFRAEDTMPYLLTFRTFVHDFAL